MSCSDARRFAGKDARDISLLRSELLLRAITTNIHSYGVSPPCDGGCYKHFTPTECPRTAARHIWSRPPMEEKHKFHTSKYI